MSKEALKERVQLTFEKNEDYQVLFSTSDENVFTNEDMAKNQAIRLKDTTIVAHKRKAVVTEAVKDIEVTDEEVVAEEVEAEEVKAPNKKK